MTAKQDRQPGAVPATFAGFASPNYTPVPDELFDDLLPLLSGPELKVVLYIVRRTFGFKQKSDAISLSQMVSGIVTREGKRLDHGTGLSRQSVVTALKSLEDRGIVVAERHSSTHRGFEPTVYRLAIVAHPHPTEEPQPTPPPSQKSGLALVHGLDKASTTDGLALVHGLDIQETVLQETVPTSVGRDSLTHVSGADAPRAAQKQPRGADLLIDELRDALGCATIGAKTREKWAAALRATLSECSAAERSMFVRWLVSSGYWCKDTVYRLSGELQKEAEAWLMAGKPSSKHRAQSTAAAPPPPTDGILRDSQGRPIWLPERTSVVDHSWGKQRDAFVAYWKRRPELMTAEQRAAANIPDSIPWYPDAVQA